VVAAAWWWWRGGLQRGAEIFSRRRARRRWAGDRAARSPTSGHFQAVAPFQTVEK